MKAPSGTRCRRLLEPSLISGGNKPSSINRFPFPSLAFPSLPLPSLAFPCLPFPLLSSPFLPVPSLLPSFPYAFYPYHPPMRKQAGPKAGKHTAIQAIQGRAKSVSCLSYILGGERKKHTYTRHYSWTIKRRLHTSLSLNHEDFRVNLRQHRPLNFSLTKKIAGFETSSRPYLSLLKYGASCHHDVIVR